VGVVVIEFRIGRIGCRITESQDETAGQSYLIYKVEMGEVDRCVTQRVSIAQPYGGCRRRRIRAAGETSWEPRILRRSVQCMMQDGEAGDGGRVSEVSVLACW
jgi:hypothetical protein